MESKKFDNNMIATAIPKNSGPRILATIMLLASASTCVNIVETKIIEAALVFTNYHFCMANCANVIGKSYLTIDLLAKW